VKYDLIIIGGGPGGCMAARTAARDGLKVLLVEKNNEAGRVTRFCSRSLRLGAGGFSSNAVATDENLKRISVTIEVGSQHHRIHLQNMPSDAVIDYRGELNPVFNETFVSPSGHSFSRFHSSRDIEAFVIDKEQLLQGLLAEASAAACEIRAGTRCQSIQDTPDGVSVVLKSDTGEAVLSARRAIIADGSFSPLIEQLGFNNGRSAGPGRLKFMSFVIDRVTFPFPELRRVRLCVPSLHPGIVNLGPWPPGMFQLSAAASVDADISLPEVLNKFLTNSPFSEIFAGSTVVAKQACNMDRRPAIRDAARGNVICVGDNAAFAETAIKGALGCGFTAARCSKEAIERGADGANALYNDYWQHAFNYFSREYNRRVAGVRDFTQALQDAETDILFEWISRHGVSGLPNDIIIENRHQLEQELPEICAKLLPRDRDSVGRQPAH
jgi:flavin-dependent dehydrogenase